MGSRHLPKEETMSKKQKIIFWTVVPTIAVLLFVGIILTDGLYERDASIQETMQDAILHEADKIPCNAFKEEGFRDLRIEADGDSTLVENLNMLLLRPLHDEVSFSEGNLAIGVLHLVCSAIEDGGNLSRRESLDLGSDFLHALAELRSEDLEVSLCGIGDDRGLIASDRDLLHVELFSDDLCIGLEDSPVIIASVDDEELRERLPDLEVR